MLLTYLQSLSLFLRRIVLGRVRADRRSSVAAWEYCLILAIHTLVCSLCITSCARAVLHLSVFLESIRVLCFSMKVDSPSSKSCFLSEWYDGSSIFPSGDWLSFNPVSIDTLWFQFYFQLPKFSNSLNALHILASIIIGFRVTRRLDKKAFGVWPNRSDLHTVALFLKTISCRPGPKVISSARLRESKRIQNFWKSFSSTLTCCVSF